MDYPIDFNNGTNKTDHVKFIIDFEKKIDSITKSLSRPYFNTILKKLLKDNSNNAITIYDYIIAEHSISLTFK